MVGITTNKVLMAMPATERQRLAPYLENVSVTAGKVLFRRGEVLRHAYFPLDTIVSLYKMHEDGVTHDLIQVGNEGLLGTALVMGGRSAVTTAMVQVQGQCLKLKAHVLRAEIAHSIALERLLLRYLQFQFLQESRAATCRNVHDPLPRLCTCLLKCVDRLGHADDRLTIGLIATLLEQDPSEVGAVLRTLQTLGVVTARGGRIQVASRARLESMACRCYRIEEGEFTHLLPPSQDQRRQECA